MVRKISLLALAMGLALAAMFGSGYSPAAAQGPDAWTSYKLNMRTGPGGSFAVVTTLPGKTGLVLEARNEDTSWVLGHTEDGAYRGWVASLYLEFRSGFYAPNVLPESTEVVPGGAIPGAIEAPAVAAEEEVVPVEQSSRSGGVTGGTATAFDNVNVRGGPGTSYDILGQTTPNSIWLLEARSANSAWVLASAESGLLRGWLYASLLRFNGVDVSSLPVSTDIVSSAGAGAIPGQIPGQVTDPDDPYANVPQSAINYNDVFMGGYDGARLANINLAAYPAAGQATSRSYAIFQQGKAMGRDPHAVAKVGDCSSEHWYFLTPFAQGGYNLGGYGNLQGVVNWFGSSLGINSESTHNGFNVNAVLAPEWSNPAQCQSGESPLQCEFRRTNPSVVIVMFGTSDLLVMTPYEFDFYLRNIINESIEAGVIPVLSTFPGNQAFWNKTLIYNQVVVRAALDYDIPLINLFQALEAIPNHGLEPDGFHLGNPIGDPGSLDAANLQSGYPVRNLVTLQTLDNLMSSVLSR